MLIPSDLSSDSPSRLPNVIDSMCVKGIFNFGCPPTVGISTGSGILDTHPSACRYMNVPVQVISTSSVCSLSASVSKRGDLKSFGGGEAS